MFIQNKYTTTYYNIINSRSQEKRSKGNGEYYESHHIIPKSLGGDNSKDNLVLLTPREHFICHWLLKYMTTGKDRAKMVTALNAMRMSTLKINYETPITARVYEHNKVELAKVISKQNGGKNNPFYGKKHTEEHKTRISEMSKGENNHFYGKTHSPEARAKIKDARAKQVMKPCPDHQKKILSDLKKGVARTPEDIAKMKEANRWKVKRWCPVCGKDEINPSMWTKYHKGGKCKGG
jgi:hypothetical protein